MSPGFILALFVLPAAIVAAAFWLTARTRPRDLGVPTDVEEPPLVPGEPDR